jgi:hypothetical protein
MRALGSLVSATLALSALGCELDERTLPLSFASGRDGSPSVSEPPTSGSTACPDIDRDGAGDCATTFVGNPSFDANADGWELEPSTAQAWSPEDARDATSSGSVFVSSLARPDDEKPSARGSQQCVEAQAGYRYRAYAEMLSVRAEGAARGTLALRFYGEAECASSPVGEFQSPASGDWDTWTLLTIDGVAPPGTRSLSVRLLAFSSDTKTPSGIKFDEILVQGMD